MELNFSEDFFKAEEREGFLVTETMKRAWAAQLVVLSEIDKVCKKHRITWFADSGTLLGAVRHKGFIPWDDDVDIAMLRPDYNVFIKEAVKDLPEDFVYLNVYNTPDHKDYLTRVVNHPVTYPPKKETLEKYYGFPFACGLDIVPIDYIPRNPEELNAYNAMIELLGTAANVWDKEDTTKEERDELIKQVQKFSGVNIDKTKPVSQQMRIIMDQVCGTYSNREADRVGYAIRQKQYPYYNWPKQSFFQTVELPFENTTIPCPLEPEVNLAIQYGKEFMTPRQYMGHDYPFYKNEIEFLGIEYEL